MAAAELAMLSLRIKPGSPFLTYVGIKTHKLKPGDLNIEQSLFVSGVPLNFGVEALQAVFSCFGDISQVILHHNKRSGMIVFQEPATAIKKALGAAASRSIVEWSLPQEMEEPVGVKAWVQRHKALRPGNAILQKQLDEWIDNFEAEEEKKEKQRRTNMAEDGWTVVVRNKGRARTTEADGMTIKSGGVASAAAEEAKAKAAKQAESREDFYRFQQRDKRRNELMDLRKQFDLDRKKIAELRQTRNFKPY
ncbi:hypothetical protein CEUSTIGMA_g11884.t1 [Chlamydomonas eustigma]|uniref:Ribosomal RNA-processing protein 7 C-terminal domain-containing protein n=1 Tax=Chlamydomonas eustigma TaxID=1157962 RepID=A0A250XMZ7_9CHLO|nr:hypothetical protein CEUSTIGMA_g11884.t1 [Chlamydomonas eustigma]|eukprot:GAX84464.1 hypothetical protein CEUSTIGMA_g11884.t1 [Chlamydomonas eustigma]